MTLLDVIIVVGGTTNFAECNRSNIPQERNRLHRVRLDNSPRNGLTVRISWLALIGSLGLLTCIPASRAGTGDGTLMGADPATFPLTNNPGLAPPATATHGGEWNFSARGSGTLTLTDNVKLAPTGQQKGDLVLGLSVPLEVRREGSRVKVLAEYTPTVYAYARTSESDNLQNNLRSLMTVEAVDDFFFVDASANVYQSYISPSGPRPESGASVTDNRTQQTTLGLSPYIRHETERDWTYAVRNDNFWNTYSASGLSSSVSSRLTADAKSPPARLRYGFDYTYVYSRNGSQTIAYHQQVARVLPTLMLTPRLSVSARLGYESNDYVTDYSGGVYGAGIDWTPTPVTKLVGFVEHRFFGTSYGLNFNHRTRFTSWTLGATSNTYTSSEQPLTLGPGTTAQVLDNAMRSRIPDPVQRQQAVNQVLEHAGLPPSLTQPYSFYTNQIYWVRQVTGSLALLGKQNTAVLTLFWQENQPITSGGNALPAVFVGSGGFRQQGVTLALTHHLSSSSNVTLTGNRVYAVADNASTATGAQSESTQNTAVLSLTHQLTPKTDGSIGVRWANFASDFNPYREQAVLAVLAHRF